MNNSRLSNLIQHRVPHSCASWLLPLLLLLTLPAVVQAEDYTYWSDGGAITITRYTGPGGAVTIPSTINGLPVTSIGWGAFSECTSLTRVFFQGHAPNVGSYVFDSDNNAIVYYLPGTTGWGTTLGGRPTMLWKPQVQTSDASFGVRTNRFGFTITGTSNLVVVVEACTNLANPAWSLVGTNTLAGGASYFSDPQWTNYRSRFYRLRLP